MPSGNGFSNLGITKNLLAGIKKLDFNRPTPIQIESIPAATRGNDIIAIAQTGSGKTLAFGIPLLQRLANDTEGTGLILVPTRELAVQAEEALQAISGSSSVRTVVLIGGASMFLQRNALKKKPRIIIATPGRLMDHIERRTIDLSIVKVFILDEADRMLDMGFLPDIRKILKSIPEKRQTMLFSATMPKEIEAIAQKLMKDPVRIEVDQSGTTPSAVSHEIFIVNNQDKGRLLAVQLRQCSGPVLVFTRTKRMARKLTAKVNNMGFATAEIHANRSLGQRRCALEGFKQGKYQILIATDIAARGIDVSGIELVVNYDMPANSEDYVHRIGRTGRAGKAGHAISFATMDQKSSIRNLERFMKIKMAISSLPVLPSEKLPTYATDRKNDRNEPTRNENSPKRTFHKDRSSKHPGNKKPGGKRYNPKGNESQQRGSRESRSPVADSKGENTFWSNFKKQRPARKKSVGQGTRRKKRSRHA